MVKALKLFIASYYQIVIVLVLLSFITYGNILLNKLFYDDEELIYRNAYVQNLRFFPKYFTENMIAGAGQISNMYRPLLLTSFALDYFIWGNNPLGYHLTSIFLHAANSILIFLLIATLFKNKFLAFLTAIFFIIHPVQTETIAYASGRTDPLFSFFALSSLLLSLAFLGSKKQRILKYLAAIILFVFALLSKETAIILPLLAILVVYTYSSSDPASGGRVEKSFNNSSRLRSNNIMSILIPFFLIDIIYITLRLTILNFANTLNFYQTTNLYSQNLAVRLYTFTRVFFEYLKVLLFPSELIFARNIDYINSPLNVFVILFLIAMGIVFVFLIKNGRKNRLVTFAFFWFFISILPVSGVIPINSIIAEHYLYLPSVSFFLLFSCLFTFLWHKYHLFQQRMFLVFFLSSILVTLLGRTVIRNLDWKDAVTFYTKSLTQSPWHVPMRHNLAMAYAEDGKFDIAIKEYQMLIKLADVYPQTHHNLANAYKSIGKYQEAEAEYLRALKMDPNFSFSLYGLADLYKITGEKQKLEEIVNKIQNLKTR